MKAHCTGSCHRSKRAVTGGAIFTVLAVLMPKCPMCIAAWLGVLGLSGLAARVDPRALWLAAALAVAVSSSLLVHRFTQRRNHHEARDGNT